MLVRVNKARRRWIAWQRYQYKTNSRPSNHRLCGTHRGMVFSYADAMFAGTSRVREAYMFRTTWEYR